MDVVESEAIDQLTRFAVDVIRQAGEEAMKYYGHRSPGIRFDEKLITEAELHLNGWFRDQVSRRFPEHQIFNFNQVDKDYTHAASRYLWIFDPLDGVDNFQAGIPIWGMSVALLENFWPVFGAILMPATGDLFHARAGGPAWHGSEKMHILPSENVDNESLLFTFSRFHQMYRSRFPGKIRNLGCTSAHICYVATGRADAALISNESFQGLAGARVIIESAGGKICTLDGSTFFLNEYLDGQRIDDHLLVVAPDNYNQVLECLERRAG